MVRIEAIIRPGKLDAVKQALDDAGIHGMSVFEIKGAGKQKGYTQHYRGSEYSVNLLPKLAIVIVAADGDQKLVVDSIATAARTGDIGDGKIFVTAVTEVVQIRTGDTGEAAVK